MILRYYGHSLFTLSLESGIVVATDPYGAYRDYPRRKLRADIVTVSHHHHDHDAVDMIEGHPTIYDQAGKFCPAPDLTLIGVETKHDQVNGAQRGNNLIFIIEAEGLHIVHMGDIGHLLIDSQRRMIGSPDVLMVPVGGVFTTDAEAAAANVRLLNPRVTIPMHYRTQYSQDMPIQTEEPFLALMRHNPEPMPLCRLTLGDISERPPVIRMAIVPPNDA